MTTWLIENAKIITDPLAGQYYPNKSVAVEGEKIIDVGDASALRSKYSDANCIDAQGSLLLPGLVDCHTHFYAALTNGMPLMGEPPQDFPGVLSDVWWKFDKVLTNFDSNLSAFVGGISSIRNGITTVFDHHASPNAIPDSLSAIAEAVSCCGLRACLAYEVTDRDGDERFKAGVAENLRFLRECEQNSTNMVKGLFGMHAVFSLSDQSIRYCSDQLAGLPAGFHIHVAEHKTEVERFSKSHSQSILEFLNESGILGPRTITAHTVHVSETDVDLLKKTGTFNVHNPRSNMNNGVGIAPLTMMFERGQPVGLGSDGFYDLPFEMILAKSLQLLKNGNPGSFSDVHVLQMLYGHNVRFAEKIFECQLGKIASGYQADILWINYDPPTPIESHNVAGHIISALSGNIIRRVWIGGREVFDGSTVSALDEEKILADARSAAKKLWSRRT